VQKRRSVKTISIPRLELNAVVLFEPTALLNKTRALLVKRSDIRMDRFYNNISMVKTTSLKMEHVCCQLSLRVSNFVIRRYVAACFFQGEPRRLRLSWVIGVDAIVSRLMVERPYLVEALLHHVAIPRCQ